MRALKLVKVNKKYYVQIKEYLAELRACNSPFDGAAGLEDFASIEEWAKQVILDEKEETVRQGYVPATTFMLVRVSDDMLLGLINIRHRLNDFLLSYGGHIGYNIRPNERHKGYAKEMLRLGLDECKKLHISKVLVTCHKNNIASRKTILANNGILENEVLTNQKLTQRYWITLE